VARFLTLITLLWITATVLRAGGAPQANTALLLGFLLLAAYVGGLASRQVQLPQITGYLLVGIVVGPRVLDIFPETALSDFRLINGGALCLIALAAGAELRLEAVRRRLASIITVTAFQSVLIAAAVVATTYFGRQLVGFLRHEPPRVALAVGLVFGLVAVAKSPATTIAVITEEKARGVLTETVLGITVVKDVVVLILIAVLIPLAGVIAEPTTGFSFDTLRTVIVDVLESIAAGLSLGWLIALYLRHVTTYRILAIFVTAFVVVELSEAWHLEYILIAMAAGFFVQNFTGQGRRLLGALEANSLPVYALFFAVAGADLRLDLLPHVWQIALLIVGVRLAALWVSTRVAVALTGAPEVVGRYAWMGFLAQAGVTLGIANIVRDRFDVWGTEVAAIIVAMIALNQIVGPPAFRYALIRAGESHRRRTGGPARAPAVDRTLVENRTR